MEHSDQSRVVIAYSMLKFFNDLCLSVFISVCYIQFFAIVSTEFKWGDVIRRWNELWIPCVAVGLMLQSANQVGARKVLAGEIVRGGGSIAARISRQSDLALQKYGGKISHVYFYWSKFMFTLRHKSQKSSLSPSCLKIPENQHLLWRT